MNPRLWIRDPSGQIREIELAPAESQEGVVVGRDSGADITLEDPAVSRFHARFLPNGDGWKVLDLGSSNKTYLNGDPILESDLSAGDLISLGDSEIHFLAPVARSKRDDHSLTQSLSKLESSGAQAEAVLTCLFKLSESLRQLAEVAELDELALKQLVSGLGADRGAVLALEREAVVCRAAHSKLGQALRGFVLSQSIYREILEQREPVLSRVTSEDRRFQARDSIVGEEIASVIAAPIARGDQIVGILYLDRLEGESTSAFKKEDLYAVAVAAELLGAAHRAGQQIVDLNTEKGHLVKTIIDTHPIIGKSEAILKVREFIRRAAPTESTVLIQGETGTGKELVARAIHYQSARSGQPFAAINCAAIPESLVESELFGHEKGAFTGAVGRRLGKFESADGGTVFLDEIGELPIGCQSKLLRLLEERCFERVGGTESISIDVRIIAATNRDLAEEIKESNFREDLFYRLNVLQVTVAPLRERVADVDLLIEHFLDHFSDRVGGGRRTLATDAREALVRYNWPGNIRQLRNAIESAVVMSATQEITLEDLPITPRSGERTEALATWQPRSIQEIEREHIARVLDYVKWNKSKAAEILGIERSTLYARLKNYDLKPRD